jgi:hypothetical protein
VTILAVHAALLEIPFDTGRLYDGDELYTIWLTTIVDKVGTERERQWRELSG